LTEVLLSLVVGYGPAAIFSLTALSCLGLPIPGALVLLAAGAFVASGELGAAAVVASALAGATAGDQTGYWLGVIGGDDIVRRLSGRKSLAAAIGVAPRLLDAMGEAERLL
jgi:membrane protein DedA with SNARE-associated domain